MTRVTRALIPCGGRGTRMLSLTHGAAKELIPVRGEPVLHHVLRECAAGGVTGVLVVTSPEKEQAMRESLAPLPGTAGFPASIEFAIQHEPRGLADAIRHGRAFAGDAPLVVALPDNLFAGDAPGVAQVIETFARTSINVVAVVEIFAEEASKRGATSVYPGRLEGDEFHIERIPDKGARAATFDTGGAASAFTGVGRYVFLPEVFGVIDEVEHTIAPGAELDDIPVMQRLLACGRLVGRRMRGRFLDVGLPSGYVEANAAETIAR